MIRITLAFLGLFFVTSLGAQQVTFEDLIKMNGENATEASKYLPQKKKWIEHSHKTFANDSVVVVLKTDFNEDEKAHHWVSIYSENDQPKTISYQTTKKGYVEKIIDDLKAAGYMLSGTKINDRSNSETYSKDEINIEVMTIYEESRPGIYYLVTLNS